MDRVVTAKVRGAEHINDVLAQLGKRVATRALKKAVEQGAQPVLEEAKARAPILKQPDGRRKPGELRDSICAEVKLNARKGTARAKIGPKRTEGAGRQDPGCWGLMEEFGSVHNPAQPYLRPAYDSKGDAAVEELTESLRSAIAGIASGLGGE
jgi:HK97 gp10 family phage protein